MTYSATKFEVATSNGLGGDTFRRYIYEKIHYFTFDLDFGVKAAQNVAQYPLQHAHKTATKFAIATSNSLGGYTFTRNVRDGQTNGPTFVQN